MAERVPLIGMIIVFAIVLIVVVCSLVVFVGGNLNSVVGRICDECVRRNVCCGDICVLLLGVSAWRVLVLLLLLYCREQQVSIFCCVMSM